MRPSIIFLDEIDGLAPVRSSKQDQIHRYYVFYVYVESAGSGRGDADHFVFLINLS